MADVTIPSIRGGVTERYLPGDRYTATVAAGQTATGGRLLIGATGDRVVQTAGAGALNVVGVAMHDAAAGEKVTVAAEGVWLITASGTIAPGDRVEAAASGQVRVLTAVDTAGSFDPRAVVGWAMADATNGNACPVKLRL